MAKKLRWHKIRQQVADGTTAENNGARFTNQSDDDFIIRQIHTVAKLQTAGIGEEMECQLSYQGAINTADDEDEFRLEIDAMMPASGATPVDGDIVESDHFYFDRGQLVLEPGESLKSSMQKSSGGIGTGIWMLGYEVE